MRHGPTEMWRFLVFLGYEDYILLHKDPEIAQTIPWAGNISYMSKTRAQSFRGIIPMVILYMMCFQYLDHILLLDVPDIPQTIPSVENT
jgi:hypothetical protein